MRDDPPHPPGRVFWFVITGGFTTRLSSIRPPVFLRIISDKIKILYFSGIIQNSKSIIQNQRTVGLPPAIIRTHSGHAAPPQIILNAGKMPTVLWGSEAFGEFVEQDN